jgi:hypothetical protein
MAQVLQRLDLNLPGAEVVTADEMVGWPPEAIDCLLKQKILVPAPPGTTAICDSCWDDHVEEVQLVDSVSGNGPRWYIPCPRFGRVMVDPERLRRWRIDEFGVASSVARLLDCHDQCWEMVQGRLWRLGVARLRGRAWDVFLVRGLNWDNKEPAPALNDPALLLESSLVFSLADVVPFAPNAIPIVPLPRVLSLSTGGLKLDRRELRILQVSKVRSGTSQQDLNSGLVRLSGRRSTTHPSPDLADVVLSPEEEEEFQRYQFNCRIPIYMSGATTSRASNQINIGGLTLSVPDSEFLLFIRLVVALQESNEGYVERGNQRGGGLVDEGIYPPDSVEPATGRLRSWLKPGLQGLKPTDFIQVHRKRVRLSTHRKYVMADRSRLMNHLDARIRALAARLPS